MTGRRTLVAVLVGVAGLGGALLTAVGIAFFLVAASGDGAFLTAGPVRVDSPSRALVAHDPALDRAPPLVTSDRFRGIRLRATSPGGRPLFVGVGPRGRVESYLARVDHEIVDVIELRPLALGTSRAPGVRIPPAPGDVSVWLASDEGSTVDLTWRGALGDVSLVLMDARARTDVRADLTVGAREPLVLGVGVIATLLGALAMALAIGGAIARSRDV